MAIEFLCGICRTTITAPAGSHGEEVRCPECFSLRKVPEDAKEVKVGERLGPLAADRDAGQQGLRRWLYVLILLALVPLAWAGLETRPDFPESLRHTIGAHAEDPGLGQRVAAARLRGLGDAGVFNELPGHRVDGALLARESVVHWWMALGAAVVFASGLLFIAPRSARFLKVLFWSAAFAGCVGILLLFAFQGLAGAAVDAQVQSVNPNVFVLFVFKLIGYSFSAADAPASGFAASLVGVTCSVGFCEELAKALPLLFLVWRDKSAQGPAWNRVVLVGLACGIGFGIAESIMLAGREYNGVAGWEMYLVRFISSVAMQGVWSALVAITIYRRQSWLHNTGGAWIYCLAVGLIILVPVVLHGLYDTLLKQRYDGFALIVALASAGLLIHKVEGLQRKGPAMLPAK